MNNELSHERSDKRFDQDPIQVLKCPYTYDHRLCIGEHMLRMNEWFIGATDEVTEDKCRI